LTDIFFNNPADGWAVGDEGAILRTNTAGNIWTTIKSGVNKSGVKHKLEGVFFVGRKGRAVGFGGTILAYNETDKNANSLVSPPKFRTEN